MSVFAIYTRPGPDRIPIRATFETGLDHDSYVDTRAVQVPKRSIGARIGNAPHDPALDRHFAA